jgi:hypothetical protein
MLGFGLGPGVMESIGTFGRLMLGRNHRRQTKGAKRRTRGIVGEYSKVYGAQPRIFNVIILLYCYPAAAAHGEMEAIRTP